jgi:hypothetical protein
MKSYIPHQILVINEEISKDAQNVTFTRAYRLAFDWANMMGMNGKKVFDFYIQNPEYWGDPIASQKTLLWCKIECTEEERKIWEENQKLNVQHAVLTALGDE